MNRNSTMKAVVSLVACLCLICLPKAKAGPVDRSVLMKEPAWALHIDVDALRATTAGKHLLAEWEKPDEQAKFAVFKVLFSFDPRKALHGVTLYGSSSAPEDGVVLIYADFDSARLQKLAEMAEDYKSAPHRQHTLSSWVDAQRREKEGGKPRTYAAIHTDRVVIFGQKQERVAHALDVLDRVQPSFKAAAVFPQFGSGVQALVAEGFASRFELPNDGPHAAVFNASRSGWLELRESDGKILGKVVLEARDKESAEKIVTLVRGLVALMGLQTEKPESVMLTKFLSVQQDGERAVVNLAVPATAVVELLNAGKVAAK